MIDADMRKAVFALHREGMGVREISRRMRLGRNTVRRIIRTRGRMPSAVRAEKIRLEPELLRTLYQECDGHAQRVHEKLVEEEGLDVTYSTLTRRLRDLGISTPAKSRCGQVPDEPGVEMQHDTTVYTIKLGGKPTRVVASLLYLRFSKRRFLKFYRVFTRFVMKCFLHEALTFWKHAARRCVIDNTNLARLRGTGADAVIVPEMERFGALYGYAFLCHEKGHANRKAGEERSFRTVETNFLPGRTFQSLEDLNRQAFQWATVRMENRPQGKAGLIPAKAFEHEQRYLIQLPDHLPAPYRTHERATDQYGYAAFEGNYYWVPGTKRDEVKVLQYAEKLKIYLARECLAEYPLPADGVKNAKFAPPGQPQPRHNPTNRRRPTQEEEKRLRAMGEGVNRYLDFAIKPKGIARHHFLRQLFALSQETSAAVFLQTIERALRYQVVAIDALRRIAVLSMSGHESSLPAVDIDESFRTRDTYLEGRLTDAPDFSRYDHILEDSEDE
jgi:transposase